MKINNIYVSLLYFFISIFFIFILFDSHSCFAQKISDRQNNIGIEVVNPTDSPVIITPIGINDNPYFGDSKMINFTIQNISQKRIIAFIPLLSSLSFTDGNTIDNQIDFEPGKIIQSGLQKDRNKLKVGEKLTLSIDYVLFSDFTSWGPDSQKKSEFLSGYYDGEKFAIKQVKDLLKNKNKDELFRLLTLEKEGKITDNLPEINRNSSEMWQRGFSSGYAGVLVRLLPFDQKQGKYLSPEDCPELEEYNSRLKYVEFTLSKYLDKSVKK
jgi:hypothetical protein